MCVTEGRSHFQVGVSLPYVFVPGCVDVDVWYRVENLLVLNSLQDALLSVIDEAHVSWPTHRFVTKLWIRFCCLATRKETVRIPDFTKLLHWTNGRGQLGASVADGVVLLIEGAVTCAVLKPHL